MMPQEHIPVVLENQHDRKHMLSVSITSIPDEMSGFTTYFDETWELSAGESRTYNDEDGLTLGDYGPEVMALAVLDDETTTRSDFGLGFDLDEIRVFITANGDIEVHRS